MGHYDTKKKLMEDISRLQKKAVRLIDLATPVSKVFVKYNILPFEKLVLLEQYTGLQIMP